MLLGLAQSVTPVIRHDAGAALHVNALWPWTNLIGKRSRPVGGNTVAHQELEPPTDHRIVKYPYLVVERLEVAEQTQDNVDAAIEHNSLDTTASA